MTLWSSPHPKESTALSLGQAQQSAEAAKLKELVDSENIMPSSATSFGSDGSEDAGFEDGPIDVDMAEEETDGIQIDCIQTLTEFEPIADSELPCSSGSPLMPDSKIAIPLPAPLQIGSAFGGNQAYSNIQNALPRIMDRPSSPMQSISYWGNSGSDSRNLTRVRGDIGLNNIGNTCFMNSGLQCLLHTSPLVEFFVRNDSFKKTSKSLVYQFYCLMKHTWFGYAGAISLHDFKMVLGNKYAQFKDCRQHDCQEFLAVLLDMLHEELKSEQKAVAESMSAVDSSVDETFIGNCASSRIYERSDEPVGSTSKSCNISSCDVVDKSDSTSTETNITHVSESGSDSEEVVKKPAAPGSPAYKRLKLENDQTSEVSSENGKVGYDNDEENEVKRKSAKPDLENNEVAGDIDDDKVENEAEGSCEDSNQDAINPVRKAQEYWNRYMRENNTVVASTFQGMFKSSVTCSECSFVSETYEPFMYLSLPIPRVMEKQLSVTYISMKDHNRQKVELTLHLMVTVDKLIQEVVKKADSCVWKDHTKYAAAEIVNYRVARVLDEKLQLRNLSTNSRNIYVYELNDNFDDKYGSSESSMNNSDKKFIAASDSGEKSIKSSILEEDWEIDGSASIPVGTNVSTSTYEQLRAPVGGGVYDSSSTIGQGVSSTSDSDAPQIDNFNKVQCNICLEDFAKGDLKQHRGCSCVLCEECLMKSVEHFKSSGESGTADATTNGSFVKCAVCLHTVDCKKAFVSLEESAAFPSTFDFITMPILFRNEPGTDDNNNSSWTPGLFSYPWLIRVPSYINASELVEYVQLINPAPESNFRILSVKSDGKSCGQCVFSSRCNGCEIPREGMISLNSCNSILISYTDLPNNRISEMQPSDMAFHNELTSSWHPNKNEEPTIDIHDCLRTFSETEHLDEQNPWFCPRCEKNQRATKALSISKFPDFLIVYLKRFVFLDQSSNKLNNKLTFPISDLDVSDYVTEGFGSNIGKYDLYSCVCHFGSASAGHYTAFAKNPVSAQWHYFNDDTITERTPGDSEYASAYVLFYEKQGMNCAIPEKCNRPLPDLNSFNMPSSSYTADTRGTYLPAESVGPVRVEGDYLGDMNLQVDSTSPSFSFPHTSTGTDILGLDVDEGVGNEIPQLTEIRVGLGLSEADSLAVTSTSTAEEDIEFDNLRTQHNELSSSNTGGADSTSN